MQSKRIGILPEFVPWGRPRERYTEEERQLLRDIAQLKGTLQRLNNYFGGRQYREVFEENRALITELKNTLTMIGKGKVYHMVWRHWSTTSPKR